MAETTNIKDLKHVQFGGPPPIAIMNDEPPHRLTMLIYGTPGSGKTNLCGGAPKPLFIDMQGGLETVRDKHVAYVQPKNYLSLLACTDKEFSKNYESVIVDTATEGSRLITEHVLELKGKSEPKIGDWQMISELTNQILRKFIALDKFVLVTCQEYLEKDDELGKTFIRPDLPGRLRQKVGELFDIVLHLRTGFGADGKRHRYALTEPELPYYAKTRFKGLDRLEMIDEDMIGPPFQVIWDKVLKRATLAVKS